jgi:phage tail-like protein
MAVFRDRPYPCCNFLVDLGSGDPESVIAGFEEVILPAMSVEVIEYRNGNDKENSLRKITGIERYDNIILKRGVVGALDLYQWYDEIRNGNQNAWRTVTIRLLDEERNPVQTWVLRRARIVRYQPGPLNARGRHVAMETVELACERIEIE